MMMTMMMIMMMMMPSTPKASRQGGLATQCDEGWCLCPPLDGDGIRIVFRHELVDLGYELRDAEGLRDDIVLDTRSNDSY